MKSKSVSTALLLLAAIIWGFAFAAQDAAGAVPTFTLGAARSILGGVFLIFVIMLFDRIKGSERRLFSRKGIDFNRTELVGGAILGVILAFASALQQAGINGGTDGGKAAFITSLYVVLVPVYSLALKRRAPFNVRISIVLSVAGFYLLCIKEDFSIVPSDLLVLLCALVFPIHILTIDRFSPKCDGARMSCVQFFTCAVVNLALALVFEAPIAFGLVCDSVLPILFLGIGSSGIAYTLQILGQKSVNPATASIILSLESVFGVVGTALFLGQTLSTREYIGCAIVLAAVIIAQLNFNLKTKKSSCEKTEK